MSTHDKITMSTHNRYRTLSWLRQLVAISGLATLGVHGANAATGGSGASLPWTTVQAESAVRGGNSNIIAVDAGATITGGPVNGSSYTPYTIAAESSGRQAVVLYSGGYVEFTPPVAGNSLVVRYSIPDSANGSAYTEPLTLQVANLVTIPVAGAGSYLQYNTQSNLTLTNAYSHFYGDEAIGPPSNTPGGTTHHHFYDEVSWIMPRQYFGNIPTNTYGTSSRVRLTNPNATPVTIDLVDFEMAPAALTVPVSNAISVTDYGADRFGNNDASAAIQAAVNAGSASGRLVWIPPGRFFLNTPITVNSNAFIYGAGIWYTSLTGPGAAFYGAPNATNIDIEHLKIDGTVTLRNNNSEQDRAFSRPMSNSFIYDIWIEHKNVGAWIIGNMSGTYFYSMRIRDLTADGINFNGSVTDSYVYNCHFRSTGDDALAMWSLGVPDQNNVFYYNTVELPVTANGIAIYGGHDNSVIGNLVVDAGLVHGGGIHVAQRFNATPLGTTNIQSNTIIRSGSFEPNWGKGLGAIWFDARDSAMSGAVNVSDLVIYDSPTSAIMFVSGVDTRVTPVHPITNVNFTGVSVANTGLDGTTPSYLLFLQTSGSASFENVTTETGYHGFFGGLGVFDPKAGFTTIDLGGNMDYSPWGNVDWLSVAGGGFNPNASTPPGSGYGAGSPNGPPVGGSPGGGGPQ